MSFSYYRADRKSSVSDLENTTSCSGPLGKHQATAVSCSMLGGHDFHTVPQRQPCETRMSVDAEGQGESSSLGSVVMVAVEVHSRPNTPDAARIASSQHVGASESVDTAPKCQKIPRRSTSFGSSAELEEEDVPVRTRPTTVGSPQHHSPFKSGHDTRTQRSLHGKHKVQTNNWPESSPKSAEAATSPGQDPSQGNGLEEQREDKYHHIWQDMRKELYQQNLVKLISRQRPGALGYIDKMSGLATGRKESLMSANFGYRIHFGDLQRIHIQYLHSKLVNLAVSAHLHDSEWRSGGKAEQIGQVMKEYSKCDLKNLIQSLTKAPIGSKILTGPDAQSKQSRTTSTWESTPTRPTTPSSPPANGFTTRYSSSQP